MQLVIYIYQGIHPRFGWPRVSFPMASVLSIIVQKLHVHFLGVLVCQIPLEIFKGSVFTSTSRQGSLACCIFLRLAFSCLYCLL